MCIKILGATALCIMIGTQGFLRLNTNNVNQYCKKYCKKLRKKLRTVPKLMTKAQCASKA
jgi:hypothetical protein